MSHREIGIYELVKGIREEVKKISDDPEIKQNPLFNLKNLELELNVAISAASEAGIKFFIVSLGGEYKKEQVNTIKLTFEPVLKVTPKKIKLEDAKGKAVLASPFTLEKLKELVETIEIEETK